MITQAQTEAVNQYLDDHFDEVISEIRRYLRQPGFSHSGEGIRESAEMTKQLLEDAGSDSVELVETGGHPIVFGHLRSQRPGARNLIIYSHYDMVPLMDESQWIGPPLEAPVVDAIKIGAPAHLGKLIIGCAANDYRGPLVATLHALKAMREVTGDIPVNVIWAIDGEEEIGAPNIHHFIAAKFGELNAGEALWMPGMHQDSEGIMQVYRGYKGNSKIEIEIKGGEWGGTLDAMDMPNLNPPPNSVQSGVARFLVQEVQGCRAVRLGQSASGTRLGCETGEVSHRDPSRIPSGTCAMTSTKRRPRSRTSSPPTHARPAPWHRAQPGGERRRYSPGLLLNPRSQARVSFGDSRITRGRAGSPT